MASMFETIRSLPLLKGISEEQVAQFLEHTNVRFAEYAAGETVASAGSEVTDLSFLISGTLRISHPSSSGKFTLNYTPPLGHPLFAFRLFGLSNEVTATAVALTHVTILSFPKSDYLNLLRTDHIYQMCALNYLSARTQHSAQSVLTDADSSLAVWLSRLLLTLTPRGATRISVDSTNDRLSQISGVSAETFSKEIAQLKKLKLVTQTKKGIEVINRNELIDYALYNH